MEIRRRLSATGKLPDRHSELPRLVGEIALNAGAREDYDTDRQDFEHLIVALERRGLRVLRPIGLESDLRHLSIVGPLGGDEFGRPSSNAQWSSTMSGLLSWALSSLSRIRR